MDYKRFSKEDLMEILDLIQSTFACKSEVDVKILLEKTKELVCAERSICGLMVYDGKGLPENKALINGSYPEGWFEVYKEKKLYEIDPIVWHHHKFLGTQIWTDTYKKYKEKVSPKFIHNAESFGLCFGIAGGIHSPNNMLTSIISFASSRNHFTTHQKAIIDTLTPHFHQAIIRVCKENEKRALPHLSPREREILQWVTDGKTNWEISVILNISERTVKFHIDNIKEKVGAVSKTHAVAILMEHEEHEYKQEEELVP